MTSICHTKLWKCQKQYHYYFTVWLGLIEIFWRLRESTLNISYLALNQLSYDLTKWLLISFIYLYWALQTNKIWNIIMVTITIQKFFIRICLCIAFAFNGKHYLEFVGKSFSCSNRYVWYSFRCNKPHKPNCFIKTLLIRLANFIQSNFPKLWTFELQTSVSMYFLLLESVAWIERVKWFQYN